MIGKIIKSISFTTLIFCVGAADVLVALFLVV